ncbi:MAG TPA: molybdopterin-dependent oxidoreductase, partial [Stellaceae bacterium]|nr:molybdopterin-dependent oxidoreductase [Stellaceae bacterium]
MPEGHVLPKIPGYCALCRSRCGCVSVVENGRLVAVERNPDHPTGRSLCGKGRAAPELVYSPDRLLHPMKRTRPKGDPDPGWQRIGWDEALDRVARELTRLKLDGGAESVAFSVTSPSASALSDAIPWIE